MPSYRAEPSRPDKAKAMTAVAAVYAALGALFLLPRGDTPLQPNESEPTVLINIEQPPEPQSPPEEKPGKAKEEEGAAGKKGEPTPVVARKPVIVVPVKPSVRTARIAGKGSATTTGTATEGTGPGAGGSGTGRGGGGAGGDGGDGSKAKLLGGNSARLPSWLLQPFQTDSGFGLLLLSISEAGRATGCYVLQSTGNTKVDAALCGLMIRQSRWDPARDKAGNPISTKVRYTATWTKY